MKFLPVSHGAVICFVSFLILCGGKSLAQHTARTAKGPTSTARGGTVAPGGKIVGGNPDQVIKLRKLSGVGRRGLVKNPEYRTSLGGTVGIDKDWCQITLDYVTAPEWVDELTFQFYAVSAAVIENKKIHSFYKTAVKYADIERGAHVCTMFLRPSALKRFGEPFAIAVEVLYKGTVVEEMSEESEKMPEKWWKNPLVIESPTTVVREGYLLTRAQSPFALISVEGYEFAR